MLNTMDRHVVRINRIVEEMFVIPKREFKKAAPLKLAPFNISMCARDIIERLELVIEQQKASVEMNVPEIQFTGDHFYWTQMLYGKTPPLRSKSALMENKTKKKTSRFRVSDNGIGIPRSDLPFICKRFYRVKKHHSQPQAKGTGLRFPIVKRAIEADADTITAASTPEVKTIFTITGPLIEAPDESDEL